MTEEQVFLAALDLPDRAGRTAYLDEVCSQNSELRRQVEELLAAHERSGQFLDEPAAEQMAAGPPIPAGQTIALDIESDDAMADNKKKNNPSSSEDGDDDLNFLSPSTRHDSLGRLGHYEVLQVLGKGGFGIVFRAFDDMLQRVVAVKVMAPLLASTSPARRRFLREARSSAQIRHDNVVHVYEVGEQPLPYLVMEFIPGETLQQKLDRNGPLDIPEILRLGRQIAEGLAAAHACDLIHRDIKPGNILLEGGSHKAKITDFGLARAADDASISQSGVIAGTPMFMSPEQALGQQIDQRADLFSLGSVLYQMASGRPPFRAPSALAVLKRVAEETPRPIPEIIPETPDWLCGIITKLHAKNPADRFQSAREVADLLADCEAKLKAKQEVSISIPGEPSRVSGRVERPAASSRWLKWAAAAVLLLPLIALTVTEYTGVTQLLRQPAPLNPINPGVAPKTDLGVPDSEGWVQLFNRKDLTGWKTRPEAPGQWEVKEGVLIGSRLRSNLYSERGDYANFHLRVEAKVNLGGDSGVFFRIGLGETHGGGFEVEIHKNLAYARKTGTVTALQDSGPPQILGLTADDSLTKPDEWLTLEIIADGDRFITKVNGKETANCRDLLSKVSRGHLGLQVWSPNTVVQFRKIEIKELPPPPDPGWVQLFNGKDLTGWSTPSPDRWKVEDGAVVIQAVGYLHSSKTYRNFHCRIEAKINEQGLGGISFRNATDKYASATLGHFRDGRKTGSVIEFVGGKVSVATFWKEDLVKPDTWFSVDLVVRGDNVVVRINDVETARTILANQAENGVIGLHSHSEKSEIHFKKIEIKELPPNSLPPTFKNTIGMEFVIVPKGKSWLGGVKGRLGDKEADIPADFYLGKYEVTQEEWEKVMEENPSWFSRTGKGMDAVKDISDADLKRFPVENVSWDNCQMFVAKLNHLAKETGWVYRLPTEMEWEYACRGGPVSKLDGAFYHYFRKPTNTLLLEQANFSPDNEGKGGLGRTCKVGSYEPNLLGLYDMQGNVWECCEEAVRGTDSRRVSRGGSWSNDAGICRAAGWLRNAPGTRFNRNGLRLARVPSFAPAPEAKTPPPAVGRFTDADVNRIAALPAAEQVEEIRKELMRRNPGFDGTMTHKIENDVVTELRVVTDQVTDIAPIRVFNALRVLDLYATHTNNYEGNGQLADLSPLAGMNLARLTRLNLSFTRVGDAGLAHFKDCTNLTYLNLDSTQVSDAGLAYFKNCTNLSQLLLGRTKVNDAGLAHFKTCKKLTLLDLSEMSVGDAELAYFNECESLTSRLGLGRTLVTDVGLAHFKNCKKLQHVNLLGTKVGNMGLAYLKDCKELTGLFIGSTQVTDLSLIKHLPLKDLDFDFRPERDAEILRSIKTLETINGKPAAELWKEIDK